jgi:hypothetical protein
MDLFKYTTAIKEIELTKTVSGLEALIRHYIKLLPSNYSHIENIDIFYYKLLAFSLNRFDLKSSRTLPGFIYDCKKYTQNKLLISIFEVHLPNYKKNYKYSPIFSKTPTYTKFMDIFEFDTNISLPHSTWYIVKLNEIIDNNPIHFTVEFNYSKDSFENYSTDLHPNIQTLTYAIRYKQVNFPYKEQTIWDLFLKDCRDAVSKFPTETQLKEQTLKLQQQITALNSLKDYINV